MSSLALALSISPASGPGSTLTATATFTFSSGPAPTGNLIVSVNAENVGSPVPITGSSQTISVTLPSSAPGTYNVELIYNGDANWTAGVMSNIVAYTLTAPRLQAVARPVAAAIAGTALTRTQIENGQLPPVTYPVSAIVIQAAGTLYDANSVATLTGTVAGAATRQTLTIALNAGGCITALTGFDPTTQWDAPPALTITRWDGAGSSANFLGY